MWTWTRRNLVWVCLLSLLAACVNISRAGAAQADGIPDRRTDSNVETAGVAVGCKRTGYLSR